MKLRAFLTALAASLLCAASAQAGPVPVSISANDGSTCSAMNTGGVDCWGKDYITMVFHDVPTPYPGVWKAKTVSTGFHYNCALLWTATIKCWGDGNNGKLGNGQTEDSSVPVTVSGITNATAVSAGGHHACALLATQEIECWGRNESGELGNGTMVESSVPVHVVGINNAVAISAGFENDETCAVLSTGAVNCWGANEKGQLGNGTTVASPTPVAVQGITTATAVAAGGLHVCAVLASGGVDCWGNNSEGGLGDGTKNESFVPVAVKGITSASAVGVAQRGYSCALLIRGDVYCWGRDSKDQLGAGLPPGFSLVPVRALISGATSISTALGHACSMLAAGGADCWGYNDYGQLGNGDAKVSNPAPVLFPAVGPEPPPEPQPGANSLGGGLAGSTLAGALAGGALARPGLLGLAVRPTIALAPITVHRGHRVRVHGVAPGCPAGDLVTLISRAFSGRHRFAGVPAVHARVSSSGRYSVTTRIPAKRAPGRYSVTGRCGGGNLGVLARLRVLR